jgi:predicted transcriptional regulator
MAMTLRLSDELDALLDQIARERGVSKQQAVALAIKQVANRDQRRKQMDEVLQLVLTRDAELMKRLAEND